MSSARALAALGRINPAARMPDVARINQRFDRHCLPRGRRDSACRPDGALSAFTRVFDALWRHPGTVASFEQESRISLTLNPS